MTYTVPEKDLYFACTELAGLAEVQSLPGFEDATPDMLQAILGEAAKFACDVLAPLNVVGDRQGVRLENGHARTADGWKSAYAQFVAGGWNSLPFAEDFGGQNLPWLFTTATNEIWESANMAFALCPLLTQSAVEAIFLHGSKGQKQQFLDKLVSGEWTGTMNLTEAHSGSDLAGIRTRAIPDGDHYRITGQKVFITYGDHDLTENIIHLVLARTPDAPEGVKGISLFIVPKYLPGPDGKWNVSNDIETVSLERKLGIHASPTAVLNYGAAHGAIGELVGEKNKGLQYMFTMMNLARHSVGVQGYAVAERAYQKAVHYASERTQGKAIDNPSGNRVVILDHPDIQRNLWTQKCRNESLRALGLVAAAYMDKSHRHPDPSVQAASVDMVEVLTPIVKAYATELGLENVSLALQVHGGMGFIEETGAAQFYRDQRITPIYEGTTGIQALDLVGRKLVRDEGQMIHRVIQAISQEVAGFDAIDDAMRHRLQEALVVLAEASDRLLLTASSSMRQVAAVADPYLRLWGVITCGWLMAKSAQRATRLLKEGVEGYLGTAFLETKIRCAEYYYASEMPEVARWKVVIEESGALLSQGQAADLIAC